MAFDKSNDKKNNSHHLMMTLYSDPECPFCHRTRIAMYEKNIDANIEYIANDQWPEDIAAVNPYKVSPTLIDRNLVLFDSDIIINYFDERFLQPPLMPSEPTQRAKIRMMLYRIDKDWYSQWDTFKSDEKNKINKMRKIIQEDLIVLEPLFATSPFFMNDDFSLLDCSIAPLLWRFPSLDIKIPAKAKAIEEYAERIFSRESFQKSLSDNEQGMR